jgi:hypothetical protein
MDIPTHIQVTVDLRPSQYQSSLGVYRMLLDAADSTPFLRIGLRTPANEIVEFQVRQEDGYIVGFKGTGDTWYGFDGEVGVWGPPCGVGVNYQSLGKVGKVTYEDLQRLGAIARFSRGATLDRRLVAIAIGFIAESARHTTVATYLIGLTNSLDPKFAGWLPTSVDFDYLRQTYFTKYAKRSKAGDRGVVPKSW